MTSRQAKGSRGWRCPYCGRQKPKALKAAHLLAEDAIREYEAGLAFADPVEDAQLRYVEAVLTDLERKVKP